jgi:hypothetical protein
LIGHNAIVGPFTLMVGYGALALRRYIPADANAPSLSTAASRLDRLSSIAT